MMMTILRSVHIRSLPLPILILDDVGNDDDVDDDDYDAKDGGNFVNVCDG